MQSQLAMKMQDLNQAFKMTQKVYVEKLRMINEGEDPLIIEESPQMGLFDDELENFAKERDEDINGLLKNMNELAEVFNELGALVLHQGTILDRIDYHLESAKVQTGMAVTQLVKAEHHQRSARGSLCIFTLITLIAVLALVLIFKD